MMIQLRRSLPVLAALICVATPVTHLHAQPTDAAELMPADVPLYVGWSQVLDKDESKQWRGFFEGMVNQLVARDEADAAEMGPLKELFETAALLSNASGGVALLGLAPPAEAFDPPVLNVAVIVDAGADTQKLSARVREFLESTEEFEVKRDTIEGQTFQHAHQVDDKMEVLWNTRDDIFYLVFGTANTADEMTRLLGDGAKLASQEKFKACREKAKTTAAPKFCAYADMDTVLSSLRELAAREEPEAAIMLDSVLPETGLSSIDAFYVAVDESSLGLATCALLKLDGPMRGILKLWDHAPLTKEDLALIPRDAHWAVAANMDWPMLHDEAMRVLDALAPDAQLGFQAAMGAAKGILGFSIFDDALPALGDTWVLYDAPDHGGFLITGVALVVDVQDAVTLQNVWNRLIEITTPMAAQGKAELRQMTLKKGKHDIHYLVIAGLPIPVSPAACFVDGRVVCGLSPQVVGLALEQADPKLRKDSILDEQSVQAALRELPRPTPELLLQRQRVRGALNVRVETAVRDGRRVVCTVARVEPGPAIDTARDPGGNTRRRQ